MPPKKAAKARSTANKVTKSTAKPTARRSTRQSDATPDDSEIKGLGRVSRARKVSVVVGSVIPDSQPSPVITAVKRRRKEAMNLEELDDSLADGPMDELEAEPTPKPAPKPRVKKARAPAVRKTKAKQVEIVADPSPDPVSEPVLEPVLEPEPELDNHVQRQLVGPMTLELAGVSNHAKLDYSNVLPMAQTNTAFSRPAVSHYSGVPQIMPMTIDHTSSAVEPMLRRRLGDLTQKHELLEQKYHNLLDVGLKEAERNFDKLKKQCEDQAKSSDQLIQSLRDELEIQRSMAQEGIRAQAQLENSNTKVIDLQHEVKDLTALLAEAKAEIKSLNSKLAASRTTSTTTTTDASVNPRYPGSMIKGNSVAATKQAATNEAALLGQFKTDLYCDLTGLIITGVKKHGGQHVFDCIQTGCNGTLHFKLGVDADDSADFEGAEFCYKPQLDVNRDRALLEVLPDYLNDEINFSRPQASKFYRRVFQALTENQPSG